MFKIVFLPKQNYFGLFLPKQTQFSSKCGIFRVTKSTILPKQKVYNYL